MGGGGICGRVSVCASDRAAPRRLADPYDPGRRSPTWSFLPRRAPRFPLQGPGCRAAGAAAELCRRRPPRGSRYRPIPRARAGRVAASGAAAAARAFAEEGGVGGDATDSTAMALANTVLHSPLRCFRHHRHRPPTTAAPPKGRGRNVYHRRLPLTSNHRSRRGSRRLGRCGRRHRHDHAALWSLSLMLLPFLRRPAMPAPPPPPRPPLPPARPAPRGRVAGWRTLPPAPLPPSRSTSGHTRDEAAVVHRRHVAAGRLPDAAAAAALGVRGR